MSHRNQKRRWLIDIFLFTGFLLSFILDLTGLSWHQWLGVAVGAMAGYHLLAHWGWLKSVTQRFIGRTSNQARLYYLLDLIIFAGFVSILYTGLIISTWFSLPLENYLLWKDLHLAISIFTLLLIVLKVGMHWRWIMQWTKKAFPRRRIAADIDLPVPSCVSACKANRRDFIKLMGIVSAGALIAIISAFDDEGGAEDVRLLSDEGSVEKEIPTEQAALPTQAFREAKTPDPIPARTVAAPPSLAEDGTSSACMIRCNLRCSYPGKCHRYVDADRNNLCDLGECL